MYVAWAGVFKDGLVECLCVVVVHVGILEKRDDVVDFVGCWWLLLMLEIWWGLFLCICDMGFCVVCFLFLG